MVKPMKTQGIPCPIIREGDNLVDIVVNSVLDATFIPYAAEWGICNKDIIGITESVVARAASQFITVDDIAKDIENKLGKGAAIALINPIYSRNRFSMILRGIARAAKKVVIVMPDEDEVGNPRGVNKFTGVNIEEYYKELCREENCECEIRDHVAFGQFYTKPVILCGLREFESKFKNQYTLKDICSDKSPDWGVLGTNKADGERLKLFPSKAECQRVCGEVKKKIFEKTGKDVVVCVYGDGCFKDPVCGIWELADPTTMPGYTDVELIESVPQEIKLKSIIVPGRTDREIEGYLSTASRGVGVMNSMGTTPRIKRDLLASIMDLNSGSGDRCTPVVLVQNFF